MRLDTVRQENTNKQKHIEFLDEQIIAKTNEIDFLDQREESPDPEQVMAEFNELEVQFDEESRKQRNAIQIL